MRSLKQFNLSGLGFFVEGLFRCFRVRAQIRAGIPGVLGLPKAGVGVIQAYLESIRRPLQRYISFRTRSRSDPLGA